jgi:hypothetical protein
VHGRRWTQFRCGPGAVKICGPELAAEDLEAYLDGLVRDQTGASRAEKVLNPHHEFRRQICAMIGKAARQFVVILSCAATARAQTPTLQDLQNKLVESEQSTQKTIQDLKAQIAALQQGQKPSAGVPSTPPAAPQASEVPVVHVPLEYYGTETRTSVTALENDEGAPRIDNEPLDPALRGFFHLPGTEPI